MNFDIEAVLGDMLSVIKGSIGSDWEDVKDYATQVLENEKDALAELANLRLHGDITEEELKSELDDERDTVEAEMLAIQVMSKAMALRAANAAMDVLFKAIKAAM